MERILRSIVASPLLPPMHIDGVALNNGNSDFVAINGKSIPSGAPVI
jgi:hypothetical protein